MERVMSSDPREFHGKTFKSGNSVALRLPKGLGVAEGTEVRIIREDRMTFRVEPVEAPRKKIDISGFWGKAPDLQVPERRDFDERPSTIAKRKAQQGQ
jgi:antitoxin VapB